MIYFFSHFHFFTCIDNVGSLAMGKTARRSIDESPSSPSSSSYLFNQQQSQTTIAGQSLRTYFIKNNLHTTSSYGEALR